MCCVTLSSEFWRVTGEFLSENKLAVRAQQIQEVCLTVVYQLVLNVYLSTVGRVPMHIRSLSHGVSTVFETPLSY